MKKVFLILLTVIMLLTTAGMSVLAADDAGLIISASKVSAKPGDTVKIPLIIEKNSGFAGLNIYFNYSDELSLESVKNSASELTLTNDKTAVWDAGANYTALGELAVLVFKVSETAEYKSYTIEINFIEAFDYDQNDVKVSISNGAIDVVSPHPNTAEVPEKPATCTENGYTAGVYCNDCGKYISGHETIMALGHDYGTLIPEVPATHHADGKHAYCECSRCHKLFTSEKVETTKDKLIISKIPHSFSAEWKHDDANHWHECSCGDKRGTAAHTFVWKIDLAATEDATGLKHEECTVCGIKHNENTVIPKLDHVHVLEEIPVKAPTCSATGNNRYFHCTKCDKYYKVDKTTETTPDAEILAMIAHNGVCHERVEPTHHADGNIEYWSCSMCGKYFSATDCKNEITKESTVLAKIPHAFGSNWKHDATNHWHECSCGEKGNSAKHTFVWITDVAPTQSAAGLKHEECTACGYIRNQNTAIPALHSHIYNKLEYDSNGHWYTCSCSERSKVVEHGYGEWKITKAATEKEKGERTRYCTICGYKQTAEIPTTSHVHTESGKYNYNNESHWSICACGEKLNIKSHRFGSWYIEKDATETENGIRAKKCTVCGYKHTEEIAPLGHIHVFGSEFKYDSRHHWYECSCGTKTRIKAHIYSDWSINGDLKMHKCTECGYTETASVLTESSAEEPSENIYEEPSTPSSESIPDSPQTGDSDLTVLWIILALLSIGGSFVTATVVSRKH